MGASLPYYEKMIPAEMKRCGMMRCGMMNAMTRLVI
jgi:hypothetical protein